MSDTPETDAAIKAAGGDWSPVLRAVAQRLERQRDEEMRWHHRTHQELVETQCKLMDITQERDKLQEELMEWRPLCLWGGTPEYIHEFIRGQQTRIHEAQDIEKTCEQMERERDEAREAFVIATDQMVIAQSNLREANKERDKARTELEMWRDGNIMHQIHRDELEKTERERDELQNLLKQIGNPTNPL